jgi:hypothetical protein
MDMEIPDGSILFLSDARGQYIPRDFAREIRRDCVAGVDDAAWDVLEAGPEHDAYWDVWSDVESWAVVTDQDGREFRLYQDGDLWLIPVDAEVDSGEDVE